MAGLPQKTAGTATAKQRTRLSADRLSAGASENNGLLTSPRSLPDRQRAKTGTPSPGKLSFPRSGTHRAISAGEPEKNASETTARSNAVLGGAPGAAARYKYQSFG